ncbi:MAG: hypothetical protein ACREQ9_02790 [Candidatus Binatia bacterium]
MTTVQGNVALVRTAEGREPSERSFLARLGQLWPGATTAAAQSGVEGVSVEIEGTAVAGVTDPNGFFAVGGDVAGPLTVLFRRAADGAAGRIAIDVPAAGILTLNNVQVDGRRGSATAERQDLSFRGLVVTTDCPRNTAGLVSRFQPAGQSYAVRFGSALRDSQGAPLACTDLRGGDGVRVAGVVNRDGTIGAVDAEKEDDSSGPGGGDDDDNSGPGGGDDDDNSGPGGGDDDVSDDDSGPGSDDD